MNLFNKCTQAQVKKTKRGYEFKGLNFGRVCVPSVVKTFLILFVNLLFSGIIKNFFTCRAHFG